MADYSKMSDDELMAVVQPKKADYSKMSDADLMKMVQPQAKPSITDAVTDIPAEIGRTFNSSLDTFKDAGNRASKGPIEGLLSTGKAALAVPGMLASPITGALRSLIGHPMAQAEHAVGSVIAPDIAAKDDPQKMYETAAGDVDTAMSAARPAAGSPVKLPSPTSPELKARAKSVFNSPEIKAIDVPVQDVSALATKIENSLIERGNRPTAGNAPGTFSEISKLYPKGPKEPGYWERVQSEMNGTPIPEAPSVQSVKIDDLRAARRALNVTAKQREPLTGAPTPDAEAAMHSIGHLDEFISGIAPELKTANADYAAAKASDRLDYRLVKAERRAAKSGTGGNLENTMRQEADKIPNSGLTPDERALRDQIVMGSKTRNALRTTGKLGVDGGLSLMLHAGTALGTHGTTLPVTIGGTMARKLGEALTRREIGQLSEKIRSRSPMAKALAANAPPAQISQNAKALAAALMSGDGPLRRIVVNGSSIMPANADQNKQ